ncbi:hypothetical protein C9J60_39180 [Streptomyces sp. A244]|nr:hypothetical protein C9J60_39180 [Streptomyces sp. A244]
MAGSTTTAGAEGKAHENVIAAGFGFLGRHVAALLKAPTLRGAPVDRLVLADRFVPVAEQVDVLIHFATHRLRCGRTEGPFVSQRGPQGIAEMCRPGRLPWREGPTTRAICALGVTTRSGRSCAQFRWSSRHRRSPAS